MSPRGEIAFPVGRIETLGTIMSTAASHTVFADHEQFSLDDATMTAERLHRNLPTVVLMRGQGVYLAAVAPSAGLAIGANSGRAKRTQDRGLGLKYRMIFILCSTKLQRLHRHHFKAGLANVAGA